MKRHALAVLVALVMIPGMAGNAHADIITGTVSGTQNLYFGDWLNQGWGGGTEPSLVNYRFVSGQHLDFTATGLVSFHEDSWLGGPDGDSAYDWNWRDNRVYSLIGVWSASDASVVPVEEGANPTFFIGSSAALDVPVFVGSVYLFLGANDGGFEDNLTDPKWSYAVNVSTAPVPEPGSLLLLGAGLVAAGFARRRRR